MAGRLYLSILSAGTRDTLTETHMHGFGLIAICGIQRVVDAQRNIRRVTADSYQGHTPSTYRTWLQGIDPQTAGKPAYTSYIGAKVAQHFETCWGVGVVCCIAADPRLKSMTRILPALLMPCSRRGKPRHVSLNARRFQKGEWESLW